MIKRVGMKLMWMLVTATTIFFTIFPIQQSLAQDEKSKKRQELEEKLRKLQEQKLELQKKKSEVLDKERPSPEGLDVTIKKYQELYSRCKEKKSERCPGVMYDLASLLYNKARDKYILDRERYEAAMREWEKNPKGKTEPVNPVPDYSEALKMYKELVQEYPAFEKNYEAYYQMGTIQLIMGEIDAAKRAFETVIKVAPRSPRASAAHFQLSDFCYMDRDMVCALQHLEQVNEAETPGNVLEMVHYRKAEIHYNMGEFKKAVQLFFNYVENCAAGKYPKQEFKDISLEYLAISFSDMPDGAQEAIDFFKKVGGRPYEAYVLYTIGMKNRDHGQIDQAITALSTALKKYPYYKDAPIAQQKLVECYIIKKNYEKANEEREKLVDLYGSGSEWATRNAQHKDVIARSKEEVKKALAAIPVYYHARAQKNKDKKLFQKAIDRYLEFFSKFPDDLWQVYEFKYYVAEIYATLGDHEKAADFYDYVASQDLSKYPKFKREEDTLGLDQEEMKKFEQKKVKDVKSPIGISQEDAAYNVVVELGELRKAKINELKFDDQKAYTLPETQKFLNYIRRFAQMFPKSENTPKVLLLGANVHYAAKSYENAIRDFKTIQESYPKSEEANKAARMLANCYANMGEYEMALAQYRRLLNQADKNSQEYQEVLDLAGAALFKKADAMKSAGDKVGAAEVYKSISREFPGSNVVDRGWFEAGVCYEEIGSNEQAALTFAEMARLFPKSSLRAKGYVRAAENFKAINKFDKAAEVYRAAAQNISQPDIAIPSLSNAADCYQKVEQYSLAGQMYEEAFQRYPTDPKAPMALYNAGLIYEKGKLYSQAITVYRTLVEKYPNSEYAGEALFSIGICYEKMNQPAEMAAIFAEYARKYPDDRYKQLEAYVRSGDAYYKMKNYKEAEDNYRMAHAIYEKYKSKSDFDVAILAKAFYMMGEVAYQEFARIELKGAEKQIQEKNKEKEKALARAAEPFGKAIELGVEEWTIRSTYMIGKGFVDFAEAVKNQSVFGTPEQKVAAQIVILTKLDKYYEKASKYFLQNIEWANKHGVKNEFIDKSKDSYTEMLYRRGAVIEDICPLLKSAPVPKGLTKEETDAYKEVIEEKCLEALDKALPIYEAGLREAAELGIGEGQWIAKIKERIRVINPSSEALNVEVATITAQPPQPYVQAKREVDRGGSSKGKSDGTEKSQSYSSPDLTRNLKRIENIMSMNISTEEKIAQLRRMEREAQRNILIEEEQIQELKKQRTQ